MNQWRKVRLDRMLVEYFLRNGYYESAKKLADARMLRDLTNVGMSNCFYYDCILYAKQAKQVDLRKCIDMKEEEECSLSGPVLDHMGKKVLSDPVMSLLHLARRWTTWKKSFI
jgi:hypothetical protein